MRLVPTLTFLVIGSMAVAQSQADSSLFSSTEGLTEQQVEMMEAPVRAWEERRDAVIAAQEAAPIDEALDVIRIGASMRLVGRDPAGEVVEALPSSLLATVFAKAAVDKLPSFSAALARKRIAEEVSARGDLHELKDAALVEQARLTFVTSESRSDVQQAISSLAASVGDSGAEGRISGFLAALTELQTPEDFDAARDLLDVATLYNARLQANWVAGNIVGKLRSETAAPFAPAEWDGDPRPALMASRAAFELGQTELLRSLDAVAIEWDMPLESRTEFLYWIGMDGFASAMYDDAIAVFGRIEDLGATDSWSAYASVRLAQTYMLKREYLEAAVLYLDAMEIFPEHPDAFGEASRGFDFLLDSGLIDGGEARTAAVERREKLEKAVTISAIEGGR